MGFAASKQASGRNLMARTGSTASKKPSARSGRKCVGAPAAPMHRLNAFMYRSLILTSPSLCTFVYHRRGWGFNRKKGEDRDFRASSIGGETDEL